MVHEEWEQLDAVPHELNQCSQNPRSIFQSKAFFGDLCCLHLLFLTNGSKTLQRDHKEEQFHI